MTVENPQIGVSTATFVEFRFSQAVNLLASRLIGNAYIPEVGRALQVASELGLGIEYAYRNNSGSASHEILSSNVPVLEVHGPIFYDFIDSLHNGLNENSRLGVIKDPVIALLAGGTIKADLKNCFEETSYSLGASSVVLHPHGAEIAYQNGLLQLADNYGISIAIEPDWKRNRESPYWNWNPRNVTNIATNLEQGICLDLSHTGISFNDVDHLIEIYEFCKQAPKGVLAIHMNVAVPGETEAMGGLPLYKDRAIVPDAVHGVYREFWQHVQADQSFKGPIIIELFAFPKGESFEQRRKAVEETLESLISYSSQDPSISLPQKPTIRPL